MASMSKQDTYRLLMKDKKAKRSTVPKIDHPLAKYNSLGQLSCVICELQVKNDLLWATHIQSKMHKQNIAKLKSLKNKPQSATSKISTHQTSLSSSDNDGFVKPSLPPSRKRTHSNSSNNSEDDVPVSSKIIKEDTTTVQVSSEVTRTEGLPSDFFDVPTTAATIDNPDSTSGNPDSTSGNPDSTSGNLGSTTGNTEKSITEPIPSNKTSTQPDKSEKESSENNNDKSDLPEGFFDNPVQDAKVRKVEYKDPLDEQWEAFQKSISKEADVSEAIIENDDEEMKEGREISEVKEQVYCYERAEKLRLKQESILVSKNIKVEPKDISSDNITVKEEDREDSDDETDLNDLFNWRFKSS